MILPVIIQGRLHLEYPLKMTSPLVLLIVTMTLSPYFATSTPETGSDVSVGEESPAGVAPETCPLRCTCLVINSLMLPCDIREIHLDIRCTGRGRINSTAFEIELRDFLTTLLEMERKRATRPPVTRVTVSESPLSRIIPELCAFDELRFIDLSSNQLTGENIRNNCLSKLYKLEEIKLDENPIGKLYAGTFTLSNSVETLTIIACDVINIEPEAITFRTDTFSVLDLSKNKLVTFDTTLLCVGRHGETDPNLNRTLAVNLTGNRIHNSSNVQGLSPAEIKAAIPYNTTIDLTGNNISELVVFYIGLGFSLDQLPILFPMNFSLRIMNNPIDCDCRLFYVQPYFHLLAHVQCQNLHRIMLRNASREKLQCQLKDNCPVGCTCSQVPYNRTVQVYCPNTTFTSTSLPVSLPSDLVPVEKPTHVTQMYTYEIRMRNCQLHTFDWRDYLNQTDYLDLYDNNITSVDQGALSAMAAPGKTLDLHKNHVETLPLEGLTLTDMLPAKIWLTDNPWRCDCAFGFLFHTWLTILLSNQDTTNLVNGGLIKCVSGYFDTDSVIHVPEDEFCQLLPKETLYRIFIGLGCFTLTLLIAGATYRLMYRYRVQIYTRFKFQPFDVDECLGEDMTYDVFLSYPEVDSRAVETIGDALEDEGYKVCMHKRDFLVGQSIFASMERAISGSKRTICFLSNEFLASEYCLFEFQSAMATDITNRRHRLYVVAMRPFHLDPDDSSVAMVKTYVKQYTYLEFKATDFDDQLCYVLPNQKLGREGIRDVTRAVPDGRPITDDQERTPLIQVV